MRIQIDKIKVNPGRREALPEHIEELAKSILSKIREEKSAATKINAPPQSRKSSTHNLNICSQLEVRHILNVSDFFFSRNLSGYIWDTNLLIEKVEWQPYFAKYP